MDSRTEAVREKGTKKRSRQGTWPPESFLERDVATLGLSPLPCLRQTPRGKDHVLLEADGGCFPSPSGAGWVSSEEGPKVRMIRLIKQSRCLLHA